MLNRTEVCKYCSRHRTRVAAPAQASQAGDPCPQGLCVAQLQGTRPGVEPCALPAVGAALRGLPVCPRCLLRAVAPRPGAHLQVLALSASGSCEQGCSSHFAQVLATPSTWASASPSPTGTVRAVFTFTAATVPLYDHTAIFLISYADEI